MKLIADEIKDIVHSDHINHQELKVIDLGRFT